jgi:formyltetrahydrofolate deformylase
MRQNQWVLTLNCQDRMGIVGAVATAISDTSGNIEESAQFRDVLSNRFFMRVAFEVPETIDRKVIEAAMHPVSQRFAMNSVLSRSGENPRIIVLVSRSDHCLEHLLYQIRVGWLRADVAAIVSNHPQAKSSADTNGIPFHHWPVTKDNKSEQEEKLYELYVNARAELIVLARYMQILSDDFTSKLFGRVINIHHSFLPSFKGAKPYHQAHARGVKIIGATAHYATADLDEGPIIEQETERVSHALSPEDLVAIGRDTESRVLARAVKYHLERRVLINGSKTVIL